MSKKLFMAVLLLLLATSVATANPWLDLDINERNDGKYFTLLDEGGNIVTYTARILDVGDSYIDANNQQYTVVGFDGDSVKVEKKEVITLPDISDLLPTSVSQPSFWDRLISYLPIQASKGAPPVIGIYQTHNAESYVPTSGVESKDNGHGDIVEVGKTLADALERQGFEVHWSDNSHLPHDGGAYGRSRRTVVELLKHQPATLIDVHRDATPPQVYETEVQGQPTTKVRIVVGRQNQNREANLEYAKRLKAVADEMYPGIIEGIFDARGNYNQDVGPRMILLEFGAHTNPLEQAEQAAEFFSKVIPVAAGLSAPEAEKAEEKQVGGAARTSIWWILGIVALFVVGFVILNKQGLSSITGFFGREFQGSSGGDGDDPTDEDPNT